MVLCSSPRSRETLLAFAERLRHEHAIQIYPLTVDLAAAGGAEQLIERVDALGIEVDTLVNNAGAGIVGLPVHLYDTIQFSAMLQLNVMALSALTTHFVKRMVQRSAGRILNVSSSAGYVVPHGLEAGYAASKAYVISFSEALSYDLRGTGVTCTHIAPGPTRTNFFQAAGLVDERRMARLGFSSAESIARIGYDAMRAGRIAVMPGFSNALVTWLARVSPWRNLTGRISAWVVSRDLGR